MSVVKANKFQVMNAYSLVVDSVTGDLVISQGGDGDPVNPVAKFTNTGGFVLPNASGPAADVEGFLTDLTESGGSDVIGYQPVSGPATTVQTAVRNLETTVGTYSTSAGSNSIGYQPVIGAATTVQAAIRALEAGGGSGYVLPIASAGTLGGVRVGANLTIDGSGILSATATSYTLPIASAGTLGGIKVGANLSISGDGTLSAVSGGGSSGVDVVTEAASASSFGLLFSNATGTVTTVNVDSAKVSYQPSTGTLTASMFNATSDARKKQNVETILGAADKVQAMRGVQYEMIETGVLSSGVIAQELMNVAPELVSENDGFMSVNYNGLVGYLIEAIKELKSEIDTLKSREGA